MPLFQKSVLNKYLKEQDKKAVHSAYEIYYSYFQNPQIQQNIRQSKEEQFQEGFLRELFVNVFGFVLNPHPDFNLTTEFKNEKGAKKADGAILKDGKAIAVIELKSTKTKDLESIRQQAFDYKANQSECVYVITSNFQKLRFYVNNAVEFEEFDLFALSKERFEVLHLCLNSHNLLSDLALKIKNASLLEEENITKKFYADYSLFKKELFEDIAARNIDLENISKLQLYKKTQKLLDRFLFIFFAEDRGLLPPNSISRMIKRWNVLNDEDAYKPLYEIYKQYFGYLNTGRPGKVSADDIQAYNGGLFLPDELLDEIEIDDAVLLKHTSTLTNYDFDSQVDVNILGHIFEHSLNEIETTTAELEGVDFDKQKSKRKKDGVFYTPKYITKYIVDNTVGKLCEEKKTELNIKDDEFAPNRKKETKKKLLASLEAYRKWLLELTICDPACGSGAFLNQALEYLINEHHFIDGLTAQLFGSAMIFQDVENQILENNIFGVDINEESVDIARLSLWLRTAQRGRKLTTLNKNIKCGNSLIDDPEVAGDKAFSWEKEFPTVFKVKEKQAWHITTATYNSRYSQRMFDNHVKLGEAVWLDEEEEIIVTKTIADIVEKDKLNVVEYNICGDHIHLLLVCEKSEVPKILQKIKSMSARACNIAMGRTVPGGNPENYPENRGACSSTSGEGETGGACSSIPEEDAPPTRGLTQTHLWTSKFGENKITSEEQLNNTINYIKTNRQKHQLPESKKLQNIISQMCCSVDHAFRKEYIGGFDVVIGNPPYVRAEMLGEKNKNYFDKKYYSSFKQYDIYVLFYEKSISILIKNGVLGFITPNKFYLADYGKKIREYILSNTKLHRIVDVSMMNVFPEASVYPTILIFSKSTNITGKITIQPNVTDINQLEFENSQSISQDTFLNEDDFIINTNISNFELLDKIDRKGTSLGSLFKITRGFRPPKEDLIGDQENEGYYPYLIGEALSKAYNVKWNGKYVKYLPNEIPESKPIEILNQPKVMIRDIGLLFNAYMDYGKFFCLKTIYFIYGNDIDQLRYLTSILNSKLMNFYFKERFSSMHISGGYLRFRKQFIEKMPIAKVNENKVKQLSIYCVGQQNLNEQNQNVIDKYLKYLQSKFSFEKTQKKLQNWHELEFAEFIKELNKAIKKAGGKKLSKMDEMEWMEVFETKKAEAQTLKAEIDKTDKEIDRMVYELYGLTEEEIQIVEKS